MLMPAPVNGGFSMEDYWVWCGSVVKGEDGSYHMFASRWSKDYPFHPGWGIASEIVRASSKTPEGPYKFQEVVLPARGAGYWDGRVTHNPLIQKHNGKYILFYVGSTYPFADPPRNGTLCHDSHEFISARSNKRIGVAWSESVFGPWHRQDEPLLQVRPGEFDDFFTSNPAPCINEDGSCLLIYKTRNWKKPPYNNCTDNEMYGSMQLAAAYAENWRGPYKRLGNKPLFANGVLEDPFVWRTNTGYSLIAKDWDGRYTGGVGDVVYAQSKDGENWDIGNKAAFTRKILWDDGQTREMGNMDRPFILFNENGEATHIFVATNDGAEAGFVTMTHSWNACIPLKSSE